MRNGVVLASLVVPRSRKERAKGLLGRESFDGAMLLAPVRSVHTIGMAFDIDVAVLDEDHRVLKVMTLKKQRVSMPIRGGVAVLEAAAGTFREWNLQPGDELEVRHTNDERP